LRAADSSSKMLAGHVLHPKTMGTDPYYESLRL